MTLPFENDTNSFIKKLASAQLKKERLKKIFTIVAICTKGNETGSNTLEFSSVVFVSVIGVLGYKEDFKALLQNGYTRKYIFGATVCMFTLLAGTMALIDTIIGNSLHFFNSNYFTLYSSLYGFGNIFINWLWLTALYLRQHIMYLCQQ